MHINLKAFLIAKTKCNVIDDGHINLCICGNGILKLLEYCRRQKQLDKKRSQEKKKKKKQKNKWIQNKMYVSRCHTLFERKKMKTKRDEHWNCHLTDSSWDKSCCYEGVWFVGPVYFLVPEWLNGGVRSDGDTQKKIAFSINAMLIQIAFIITVLSCYQ